MAVYNLFIAIFFCFFSCFFYRLSYFVPNRNYYLYKMMNLVLKMILNSNHHPNYKMNSVWNKICLNYCLSNRIYSNYFLWYLILNKLYCCKNSNSRMILTLWRYLFSLAELSVSAPKHYFEPRVVFRCYCNSIVFFGYSRLYFDYEPLDHFE